MQRRVRFTMNETAATPIRVTPPYNRLGLDYHNIPPRKIAGLITDAHTHAHNVDLTRAFLQAADDYSIGRIWTMAPLEDVDAMQAAFPGRFEFIAIPKWQELSSQASFIDDWLRRLDGFRAKGSRLMKFHAAPGTQKRMGMDLDHPQLQRVMKHAWNLGFHFMTHVGDPKDWFGPDKKYKPSDGHKSFAEQFAMLDRMLEQYPGRTHLGAHMGGSVEVLDALGDRLDRFAHYRIDSSATKWMVRGIAQQPVPRVREFFIRYQQRILFGSDLVVGDKYNYDHYASRYWVHQHLWETSYDGPSPIEDPDAPGGVAPLKGLNLPAPVLERIYRTNAEEFFNS